MRITNSMITDGAAGNINGVKTLVDKTNTQMTTQKKISRPSQDPVIAIRSLRLQTSLNKINQYYEKNIPDAESWMDVTETALSNIKDIVTSMRTLGVQGSTDTLTQDDRNTILSQLKSLQQQVYHEGNADYAGRTVFTGYRTDKQLSFTKDDSKTSYNISEPQNASGLAEKRFYTNELTVPETEAAVQNFQAAGSQIIAQDSIQRTDFYVSRFAYDNITELQGFSYSLGGTTYGIQNTTTATAPNPSTPPTSPDVTYQVSDIDGYGKMYVFENEDDWANFCKYNSTPYDSATAKTVGANDIVVIKSTGEAAFGQTIAGDFRTNGVDFTFDYNKTGFKNGELRPEYYFDCIQLTDETGAGLGGYDPASMTSLGVYGGTAGMTGVGVEFDKVDDNGNLITYDIQYTIAQNQELTVNLEAGECIDHNIYQDMGDMIDAVQKSINAHDKLTQLENMKKMDKYADDTNQAALDQWIEMAQKEADYYDDNLSKLYSTELGKCDSYLADINLSITKIGCRGDQLKMTETRMNNQQETVEELQSENDDMDLSDIILKYTAAYTAYQSSLTAAGRLGQQTLLNYI